MGEPKIDFMGAFFDQMRTIIKAEVRAVLHEERAKEVSPGPRYVTPNAFAKELAVTSHAVRQWCRDGMPSKRVGSNVRVIRDEALTWLDTQNKRSKR